MPETTAPPASRPADAATGAIRLFDRLDRMIARTWDQVATGDFWRQATTSGLDRALYRDLMVQVFHYTRFNSLNQR